MSLPPDLLSVAKMASRNAQLFEGALLECRSINVLLGLARKVFQDLTSKETVVRKILECVLELIDGSRSSYFHVDPETEELVATVFDVGAKVDQATAPQVRQRLS